MKISSKIRKVVIPAAGIGTGLLPATKSVPKELLPVVDTPIIQYVLKEAIDSGIDQVIIVTGRGKSSIIDHFDVNSELEQKLEKEGRSELLATLKYISSNAQIVAVRQQNPQGLGHAVLCAKNVIGDEPFAVLLGDDLVDSPTPCLGQMLDVYHEYEKSVVGVMRIDSDKVGSYGVCGGPMIGDRVFEVEKMVEKPDISSAPSNFGIIGRYILNPSIFNFLEELEKSNSKPLQLTDAMELQMQKEGFVGYEFIGTRYDAGDKLGYLQASIAHALKRPDMSRELKNYLRTLV